METPWPQGLELAAANFHVEMRTRRPTLAEDSGAASLVLLARKADGFAGEEGQLGLVLLGRFRVGDEMGRAVF